LSVVITPQAMSKGIEFTGVNLTPKAEKTGATVVLKVFWKTTAFWSDSDIAEYHEQAPNIIERLMVEQYWNREGAVSNNKFTCEDFALRVLCEFASKRGLPVVLKTGVRTYKNMEVYNPEQHDKYSSTMYGFSEMVMLTYGAPDMQRVDENTVAVAEVGVLKPGDILALIRDIPMKTRAHHIQMAFKVAATRVDIRQGNTGGWSTQPWTAVRNVMGKNMADPQNEGYAGMPIESGYFEKVVVGWDYHNLSANSFKNDYLKNFDLFRWNFFEFNGMCGKPA
jgi:hypothetical protein